MKIIGIVNVSFSTKDGNTITGKTFHVTSPVPAGQGSGEVTDHFFLSAAKLETLDFTPELSQQIQVLYNRYGKVASLVLVDPLDSTLEVD